MLKKSLVLGVLAAMTMAPAAFAGSQTQGNSTVTTIETGVVGNRNSTYTNNTNNVRQSQGSAETGRVKRHARKCRTSPQVQGNTTDTVISTGVSGNRNRTVTRNGNNVNQSQVASCR